MYLPTHGQPQGHIRPKHADISNAATAPALQQPWLNYISTLTSRFTFSNGRNIMEYQMLRLNSKKDPEIENYVPESPVDPGAEATQGQRTWYRDAIKALIHDKQILSTVNNLLLSNIGLAYNLQHALHGK